MQPVQLSKGDSSVFAQVFDPESGPAKAEVLIDQNLPTDRNIGDGALLARLKSAEKKAINLIEAFEKSTDKSAQSKDQSYRRALQILDSIVTQYTDYASARNNRAQLRRWRFGDQNLIRQLSTFPDSERSDAAVAIVQDLQCAITLASPERPNDAVSSVQGRLLAQAHTQLGALYLAAAKDLGRHEDSRVVVEILASWTTERFEDEASRLFYVGGLYGNEVAKALAVHTNPHAKLCGSIVREAMRKELASES